jgi:hypothetical protein
LPVGRQDLERFLWHWWQARTGPVRLSPGAILVPS